MLEVTVQARDIQSAERRWNNALEALDPARYPGLKIETQVEPYWQEVGIDDNGG